jgi:hypothetical protein
MQTEPFFRFGAEASGDGTGSDADRYLGNLDEQTP